ncbi:hypothetical protein H2201_002258 [Coniosporium apollinis]|uniref:DNA replication checkpoint mediator MRC1 domain-containing protein n=1 Tax=Coniosporium apollinis TaxID=61459 RepID=A0ABQ9P0D3_9PEZI|nr:hypothetical protein H2201_002258 [Coniosporium apollinis]
MALPSTPARSSQASAASTPSSRGSRSPIELTPRSKVKALLARFDEDSDDELPTKKPARPAERPIVEAARLPRRSPALSASRSSAPERTYSIEKDSTQHDAQPRTQTPDLFVSPAKIASSQAAVSDSDSDLPAHPTNNARFMELVARKRAEREARERDERRMQQRTMEADKKSRIPHTAETDSEDETAGRKLTQQARPTRRAGKKAMEEMNRETQRMQRNMQLTHQARTKKRITIKDLFAKLNYNQPQVGKAVASSDAEVVQDKDTPPTSPPVSDGEGGTAKEVGGTAAVGQGSDASRMDALQTEEDADDDLPSLLDIIGRKMKKQDKGKAPMRDLDIQAAPASLDLGTGLRPKASSTGKQSSLMLGRNSLLPKPAQPKEIDLSSDDDTPKATKPRKSSRLPIFDQMPAKKASESNSMLTLRALAHVTSPSKTRRSRASITPSELQLQLQRRARQQAQKAREERIADLKARGIIVQTEEERERDQLELDNLLDKARKEAMELAKKEKDAIKKDRVQTSGDRLPDSEDEDEDEDYITSEEENEGGVELSGSEDEDEIQEGEEDGEPAGGQGLFDDEADDGSGEEEEDMHSQGSDVEMDDAASEPAIEGRPVNGFKQRKNRRVIADEDDEDVEISVVATAQPPPSAPSDEMAAFGFGAVPASSMGLTQMFAGTMLDTQSQSQSGSGIDPHVDIDQQQDSLDFLRGLSSGAPMNWDAAMVEPSQDFLIQDSQVSPSQNERTQSQTDSASQQIKLGISQLPSQLPRQTPFSEVPDPTQDIGFQARTPAKRFVPPPSTVETEILPIPESPVVRKKGRLQRRSEQIAVLSDLDEDEADIVSGSEGEEHDISANAFDLMRKAAKKQTTVEAFDKKNSNAREMVQEQAEESEDEYAGLGGASDDESTGEMDEEVAKMIDEGEVETDERQIAAFFADKERKDDEKRIDKLYKDLMNGALRRKRGADFDLSDDDDDRAQERRRRKQREFAKMRKALLADENIGKIAENPKKAAFLAAIEDRLDDDIDFLKSPEKPAEPTPSAESERSPKRRRRRSPDSRRTAQPSRILSSPSRVASLSRSPSPNADPEPDTELYVPPSPPKAPRPSFINRLSLLTTTTTTTTSTTGPLAFHAPTPTHRPGFRVPSLLRQATSNQSLASATSVTSGRNTPVAAESTVRRGGTKKSNIHYQAREAERKAKLEEGEKRRAGEVERAVRRAREGRGVLAVLENGRGFE